MYAIYLGCLYLVAFTTLMALGPDTEWISGIHDYSALAVDIHCTRNVLMTLDPVEQGVIMNTNDRLILESSAVITPHNMEAYANSAVA